MKTVGIFSGSFNPIHIGHLALANWICEYEPLDELWFLVTPHNPLKAENTLMNDHFRLSLVEVSIKDYGKFRANTLKPATVESGATVRVPLFINEGESIEIDTRDGSYLGQDYEIGRASCRERV